MPTRTAEREAHAVYKSLFPSDIDTIPTSGTDLQCAFNAYINSLSNIQGRGIDIPIPTLRELQEVFDDNNFQSELRTFKEGYTIAKR